MRALKSLPSRLAAAAAVCLAFASIPAQAAEPVCEIDTPVRFSGLNWESNLLLVEIERFIVEHGYGCDTDSVPGETLAMLAALQRGDVEVTPEIWPGQIEVPWKKALDSKKVIGVGHVFDAGEGWYIPRYTAEKFPELKRAADLPRFKEHFTDPEDPSKGRIYGCPAGWACDTLNVNLLRGLKLEDDYTLFAPGAGAAQKAAIVSAYKRKRDIVFYYWTPTALVGALDLVKLELPAYDEKAYTCLTDAKCENPVPTEFRVNKAVTGLNADFSAKAPKLTEFFTKLNMPEAVIDDTLGWMEREEAEADDAARYFFKEHAEVWRAWLPADAAERVQKAL